MKKTKRSKEAPGSRMLRLVREHFPIVSSVRDARESVVIEVTRGDINWAAKKNHSHCALARACERSIGVDAAIISTHVAFLIEGDEAVRYRVPDSTRAEIVAFDRGGSFMPGEYLLLAPGPSMRIGVPRVQTKVRGKRVVEKRRYVIKRGVRGALWGSH